jgi:hypothetical protein
VGRRARSEAGEVGRRLRHALGSSKPLAYQFAEGIGQGNTLGALDAFQHHVLNAPHGLAQLAEHGVNAAANRLLPADSSIRGSVNRTVASDDAALAQREA